MKSAIYIEDGVVQLVITPETDFEKSALHVFEKDGGIEAQIFNGSFYDCRGGWVRQNPSCRDSAYSIRPDADRSLIIKNTISAKNPLPREEI